MSNDRKIRKVHSEEAHVIKAFGLMNVRATLQKPKGEAKQESKPVETPKENK